MSSNFFLTEIHPEVLSVIPRAGGIGNIILPVRSSRKDESSDGSKLQVRGGSSTGSKTGGSKTKQAKKSFATKVGASKTSASSSSRKSLLTVSTSYGEPVDLDIDSCPRQYKVKQIIAATPWSVELDEYLEPSEDTKIMPDPFQDAVDMLAMSISVIMLLSRSYDGISETNMKWVFSYLKCIKDEFGRTPPNVQGMLNHINKATGGEIKSFLDEDDEPPELGENDGQPPSPAPAEDPPAEDPPAEEGAEEA